MITTNNAGVYSMKNITKCVASILSLVLIVSSVLVFAEAETDFDVWDGTASTSISGTGAKNDPYLIGTAEDFAYFANTVNAGTNYSGKYVVLTIDLVMNQNADGYKSWETTAPANTWTSIGDGKAFKGNFDGKNHTVSGVYVNTTSQNCGLFGRADDATVSNLNVVDSYIEAQDYAAGLIGYASNDSKIKNCSFTGLVKTKDKNGWSRGAGLIAQVYGAVNVEKCFTECKIISGSRSAGLVGVSEASTTLVIKNSYSIVDIPVVAAQNTPAGLLSFAQGNGSVTIIDSYTIGIGANPSGAARELRLVGSTHDSATSTCTNSYYCQTSGSVTMWGVDQGTKKAPADFANGTVTSLLNNGATEPIWEQGVEHPQLIPSEPVEEEEVVDKTLLSWTFETNENADGVYDYGEYVGTRIYNYGTWNNNKAYLPFNGYGKDGSVGSVWVPKLGASFCSLKLSSVKDDCLYTFSIDAKVVETNPDITVQIGLFRQDSAPGSYSFRDTAMTTNDTAIEVTKVTLDKTTDYTTYTVQISGADINRFLDNFETNYSNVYFGVFCPTTIGLNGEKYEKPLIYVDNFKISQSKLPDDYEEKDFKFNSTLLSWTFETNENADGVYDYGEYIGTRIYNYGTWNNNREYLPFNGYGKDGSVGSVWVPKLGAAFCSLKLSNVKDDFLYTFSIDAKVIKTNPDITVQIGLFRQNSEPSGNSFRDSDLTTNDTAIEVTKVTLDKTTDYTTYTVQISGADINRFLADFDTNYSSIYFGVYCPNTIGKNGEKYEKPLIYVDNFKIQKSTLPDDYEEKKFNFNNNLLSWTFETNENIDGVYDYGEYIGTRIYNYGTWNNNKEYLPFKGYGKDGSVGSVWVPKLGAAFCSLQLEKIRNNSLYSFSIDAKVIKTNPDITVQIGLFRQGGEAGSLSFRNTDMKTYDTAIKVYKVKLDKKTDYKTYTVSVSGKDIKDFLNNYSTNYSKVYFGIYCPETIGKNGEKYEEALIHIDNFKIEKSEIPENYVPLSEASNSDVLDYNLNASYGEDFYSLIDNPNFENQPTGVFSDLPSGFSIKEANNDDAMLGSKYLSVNTKSTTRIAIPITLVINKTYTFGFSARAYKGASFKVFFTDDPNSSQYFADVSTDPNNKMIKTQVASDGKIYRYGFFFRNRIKTNVKQYIVIEVSGGRVDFDGFTLTNKQATEKDRNHYESNAERKIVVIDIKTGKKTTCILKPKETIYDKIG